MCAANLHVDKVSNIPKPTEIKLTIINITSVLESIEKSNKEEELPVKESVSWKFWKRFW